MIYLIGLGLNPPASITQEGMQAIQNAKEVYVETYTSLLPCTIEQLETAIQKKVLLADREQMEQRAQELQKKDIAILIMGDPLAATTHIDLADKVIHNASIFTAVAQTGLSIYKFGKTTSIPFPQKGFKVNTPMQIINENKDAHTLCLLDINPKTHTTMSTKQAIELLLRMQNNSLTENNKVVLCTKLGTKEQKIIYTTIKQAKEIELNSYPQCLIIPGKLHFKEEEMLKQFQ